MSTTVDTEEIASTRSEKVLAFCLAAFLLVGTIWFYAKVPVWVEDVVPKSGDHSLVQKASDAQSKAWDASAAADTAREEALTAMNVARDEYSLAITRKTGIDQAQQTYEQRKDEYAAARLRAQEAQKKAEKADDRYMAAEKRYTGEQNSGPNAWIVALTRLAFILALVAGSYALIGRLRIRESRFLPLAFASAGVGAVMSLVFLGDYLIDWSNFLDLGPLVLSLLGAALTLAAFWVLQRHLAARVPGRRVRKGECPFCGFPLHEAGLDGPHCAGCGRDVVAACATCDSPRRVGSPHCSTCGAS